MPGWSLASNLIATGLMILAGVLFSYFRPGGLSDPARGRRRWVWLLAVVSLAGYPTALALVATTRLTGWAELIVLTVSATATVTTLLVAGTKLRAPQALQVTTSALGGVAVLMWGMSWLSERSLLGGLALLLWGIALLLLGLALLHRFRTLWDLALLAGGIATIGITVPPWETSPLHLIALALWILALLLWAIALFRDEWTLRGCSLLPAGVAILLWGALLLQHGWKLQATAVMLWGSVVLLASAAILSRTRTLWGVSMIVGALAVSLWGTALLLGEISFLRDGWVLLGAAMPLGGVAMFLGGLALLFDKTGISTLWRTVGRQFLNWLNERTD